MLLPQNDIESIIENWKKIHFSIIKNWLVTISEDFQGFFFWKYTIILHYTRFQVLLSLSTEYFSPFHHCTCFLLVSLIIFSFWWYLPPIFRLHSQTALLLIKPPNKKTHRNLECQQGFHLVLWRNFPNI